MTNLLKPTGKLADGLSTSSASHFILWPTHSLLNQYTMPTTVTFILTSSLAIKPVHDAHHWDLHPIWNFPKHPSKLIPGHCLLQSLWATPEAWNCKVHSSAEQPWTRGTGTFRSPHICIVLHFSVLFQTVHIFKHFMEGFYTCHLHKLQGSA